MRRYLIVAAGGAAVALAATPADAALCIGIGVNGGGAVNVACDTATPGSVSYVATLNGYSYNVGGNGFPDVSMPELLTQTTTVEKKGGVNAIIDVYLTQTDLTPLTSSLLSTFTSNTARGVTAEITSFYDITNGLFAGTQLQTANFTGSGVFAGANGLSTPGLWSETIRYRLNFTGGAGSNFNGTANLKAVPEPGTWCLMLLGFGGIGMAIRRRRQPKLAQLA